MITNDCKNNCGMIGIVRSCGRTGARCLYLWWVGVGDGEAPTWAHGPGTPVCHSTSAINNGINPTKGKMINLNKNYLDTRACLWISQQRPLLGSDWYFLFFIPPCHCYLWSTQWGCHATQSVVPAVLCSLYLGNCDPICTSTNIHEKTTNISSRTLWLSLCT